MKVTFDLYKSPLWRLEKLKKQYEDTLSESQTAISRINHVIQNREMVARHRARFKSYGEKYASYCENTRLADLVRIIQRDLSCSEAQALKTAELAKRGYDERERNKRNDKIVVMAEFMPVQKIALQENLTRQQVYNIIRKAGE